MRKIIIANFLLGFILLAIPTSVQSYQRIPTVREYAQIRTTEVFGATEWSSFETVVDKESHWTIYGPHYPVSKLSSAHGLCGFLNATWKGEKTDDPYRQIDECLIYVKERYKTPKLALQHHIKYNWY